MITHIFSDLDGTLLDGEGNVTEVTAETIKKVGIPFSLVSARTPNDMEKIVSRLSLTSPQVAFNGGLIYRQENGKRIIMSEDYLEWKLAEEIIQRIQQEFPELGFSFYDENNWYTCRMDKGIKQEAKLGSQLPQLVERTTFFNQQPIKIFKIMLWIFDEDKMSEAKEYFKKIRNQELSVVQSSNWTLEITNYQAQKSKGIDYVLNHYQLNHQEVAAFGDGHNDIPMLKKVGHPVVMANASDEVKAYGRYITKTNVDNGVSFWLNNFLINQ